PSRTSALGSGPVRAREGRSSPPSAIGNHDPLRYSECIRGRPVSEPTLRRASGVLLHPTSLPGPFGIGDLGPAAYRWVETLAAMRQSWWQVLPLGPTGSGDSPYQSFSAFAGNINLLSPELLERDGLVSSSFWAGQSF